MKQDYLVSRKFCNVSVSRAMVLNYVADLNEAAKAHTNIADVIKAQHVKPNEARQLCKAAAMLVLQHWLEIHEGSDRHEYE